MNSFMTRYKKIAFSAIILSVLSVNADPEKCKPCQAAAAAKLAAAQAAAAAKLAAQQAAQQAGEKHAKPKHSKPKRNMMLDVVDACCEYCAQPGSLGCQGINSSRCNTCQAGLLKMSIAEAAALAALEALNEAEAQLDEVPALDKSRAPREELSDPCFVCEPSCADELCNLDCKLRAIYNCCVNTNQQVRCSAADAKRCCKKLRHKLDDLEDDVEDCCSLTQELIISQIDAAAECCSVIETRIGDLGATIPSVQDCGIDVLAFVNSNNDDVITWLKRLYVLMYQTFSCSCCNF